MTKAGVGPEGKEVSISVGPEAASNAISGWVGLERASGPRAFEPRAEMLCDVAGDVGLVAAGPCKTWSPFALKSAGDGLTGGRLRFGFAGLD